MRTYVLFQVLPHLERPASPGGKGLGPQSGGDGESGRGHMQARVAPGHGLPREEVPRMTRGTHCAWPWAAVALGGSCQRSTCETRGATMSWKGWVREGRGATG